MGLAGALCGYRLLRERLACLLPRAQPETVACCGQALDEWRRARERLVKRWPAPRRTATELAALGAFARTVAFCDVELGRNNQQWQQEFALNTLSGRPPTFSLPSPRASVFPALQTGKVSRSRRSSVSCWEVSLSLGSVQSASESNRCGCQGAATERRHRA